MKKENLIALTSILSLLKGNEEFFLTLTNHLKQVRKITLKKPEGIDPVLELRIGLHKFFSLEILKFTRAEKISTEKATLAYEVLNDDLIYDEGSYGRFLTKEAARTEARWDYRPAELMHSLVSLLLLEAFCQDDILLTPRERTVLTLFRGLKETTPTSLEVIGENLNLTRERTRNIKDRTERRVWKKANELGIDFNF